LLREKRVQLKRDKEGGVLRWIWEPVVAGRLSSSGLHFKVLQWSRAHKLCLTGTWDHEGLALASFSYRAAFGDTAPAGEESSSSRPPSLKAPALSSYISGLLEEITIVYRLGIMLLRPFTQGSL
jgi:hypothetical protein